MRTETRTSAVFFWLLVSNVGFRSREEQDYRVIRSLNQRNKLLSGGRLVRTAERCKEFSRGLGAKARNPRKRNTVCPRNPAGCGELAPGLPGGFARLARSAPAKLPAPLRGAMKTLLRSIARPSLGSSQRRYGRPWGCGRS